MPEISRFYGIIVFMFFNDHNPPHFKVKYSEFEANIIVENGALMNGDLPLSKLKLVQAWAEIHKEELLEMWLSKNFTKLIHYNNVTNNRISKSFTLLFDMQV